MSIKLFLLSLLICTSSFATDYYVNDGSTTGDIYTSAAGNSGNNGTSASTPMESLTNVLTTYAGSLISGDNIYIDAGTYLTTDANLTLSIAGISIIGAGSNLTFFDNDQSSTDANRWATVSANDITIQGIYLTGYNFGTSLASTLLITGGVTNITISDVQANENAAGGGSSAIVVNGGSQVDFIGGGSSCNPGASSIAGGGVNIEGNGNNVTFTNYAITGNEKSAQGGSGIYIAGDNTTTVTVTNSIIADNTNTSSSGGGAIFISGANLNLIGSCINGNETNSGSGPKYGGAIAVARGATLDIDDCSFNNNVASNSGKGGAIGVNTSFAGSGSAVTIAIDNCSFSGNTATSEGNHIYARVGSSNAVSFTINESSFTATSQDIRQDNTATFSIQNSSSPVISGGGITMVNTTDPSGSPSTACPSSSIACFSVLPVELIFFEGRCENGISTLHWSTSSETNNDRFIIERASENLVFQTIGTVKGSGYSQEKIDYSFQDLTSKSYDMSYYRLTQIDTDGQQEVFSVISQENCNNSDNPIIFFDNGRNTLSISFPKRTKFVTELKIYSSQGKLAYSKNLSTTKNTLFSETIDLPTGIYFCTLEASNFYYTTRIIKQ